MKTKTSERQKAGSCRPRMRIAVEAPDTDAPLTAFLALFTMAEEAAGTMGREKERN